MAAEDPQKKIAIEELRRMLDNQLHSLSDLQTKVGVALGFTLTSLGLLFSLGHAYITPNQTAAYLSAELLIASTLILGGSYLSIWITDAPDPEKVKAHVETSGASITVLQTNIVNAYATAYKTNKRGTVIRFLIVNIGISLFLIGVVVFVVGVLL